MGRIKLKDFLNNAGFTLVELLLVISIIAILIAAIMPAVGTTESARISTAERDIEQLHSAAMQYLSRGRTTYNGISITQLKNDGILGNNFSETGTNPWGGDYSMAPASNNNYVIIILTNIPDESGNALLRKFNQKAQSVSFSNGTLAVTF